MWGDSVGVKALACLMASRRRALHVPLWTTLLRASIAFNLLEARGKWPNRGTYVEKVALFREAGMSHRDGSCGSWSEDRPTWWSARSD
eukprot:3328857-Rhodomonas_salina.1